MVEVFRFNLEEQQVINPEEKVWQDLFAAEQNDTILKGNIFGIEEYKIQGMKVYSLVVMLGCGIKGIIPQHQSGILDYPVDENGEKKLKGFTKDEKSKIRKHLMELVGQTEPVKVYNIDQENKLVQLNRAAALEHLSEITWKKISKGKVVTAVVRKSNRNKTIVEVGGINTEMPAEELSWGFINDPRIIVTVGQKLKVKITEADEENKEIKVSHRECTPNPWPECTRRYMKNNLYQGKVTGVIDKAVFVNLEPGVDVYCKHMKFERAQLGDDVVVKVQGIDAESKRMWGTLVSRAGRSADTLSTNISMN